MLRDLLQAIVRFLFRLLAHVETIDMENIPPTGGYILTSNHLSILDSPLFFISIKRRDITALVAKKYQKNAFTRWLVNVVHGIWLNRTETDTQAIRAACEYLERGGLLGVSPEGTRSQTGGLIPPKTGVAYLADKANVPIIPVAITGSYTALDQLRRLKRPTLTLRVGKPFTLPPIERKDRDQQLKRNTDEIMCRIAAMLPPEHRGVYANHPRLRELLEKEAASLQPPAVSGGK